MSRRSGRLQAKNAKTEAQDDMAITRKRKSDECTATDEQQPTKRTQHFEIQNCWSPQISKGVGPCILIETPHKEIELIEDSSRFRSYRFTNYFFSSTPLPVLSWGDTDVWSNMVKKDGTYTHNKHFLLLHPTLQPKMRTILIDWLLEVCEVYSLHRETFYLAQDFFDRFMLTQIGINKSKLQLIGITALFIAAKLEEIYPPKLYEFAYVTDGACTDDEILSMELIMLKALKWELCPVTIISWLNIYLQICCVEKQNPSMLLPQYSQDSFVQIAQLLDLCILDLDSLGFHYRVLTAAAVFHHTSLDEVRKATGLDWEEISDCVTWMTPYFKTVQGREAVKLNNSKKIPEEDKHNIQTHTNYMEMMEEVRVRQSLCVKVGQQSPVSVSGILTPPKSTEKHISDSGH